MAPNNELAEPTTPQNNFYKSKKRDAYEQNKIRQYRANAG